MHGHAVVGIARARQMVGILLHAVRRRVRNVDHGVIRNVKVASVFRGTLVKGQHAHASQLQRDRPLVVVPLPLAAHFHAVFAVHERALGHLPGIAGVLVRFHIAAAQIQRRNHRRAERHAIARRVFADDPVGLYGQRTVRVILAFASAEEEVIGNLHARNPAGVRVAHEGIQRRPRGIQPLLFAGKAALLVVKQRHFGMLGNAPKLLFVGQNQRRLMIIQAKNPFVLDDIHTRLHRFFSIIPEISSDFKGNHDCIRTNSMQFFQ